jgi:peptidoglycan/xylan/chitin deacetylase (PgdA/CDA1 family)
MANILYLLQDNMVQKRVFIVCQNLLALLAVCLISCKNADTQADSKTETVVAANAAPATDSAPAAKAEAPQPPAGAFQGKEVPILCYHQLRDWTAKDSKGAKDYIMPMAEFKEEMKALHDSGYTTILPDELMEFLQNGKPLPAKPVMLTFDDATDEHYLVALPELDKYGFKAVFFVMTVVLNRPNYLTKGQVKEISDKGHVVASHTWDHHMTTKYTEADWVTQSDKPRALLETITGKPIKYFAYPFGLWNKAATQALKKRGYTAAFQLSAKRDDELPYFTIRRVIADGHWNTKQMFNSINRDFKVHNN